MTSVGTKVGSLIALQKALLETDSDSVRQIITEALESGSPIESIECLIVPVLEQIEKRWEAGQVSLSQVYMSGRLCEAMVDTLLPPVDGSSEDSPHVAIAVLEDYHMMGLRVVYAAMRASGHALRNYGRCDLNTLVENVRQDDIRILLISVLMLPSALRIRDLRARLATRGHPVRIIVGGAPFRFDPHLWREVGADAGGRTAMEGVTAFRRLARGIL